MPAKSIPAHLRQPNRTKAVVALSLTFAAGYVDIVGFIRVARTFTAHMTGNTVHLAHRLTGAEWYRADLAASALVAFVAGSIVGRCMIEVAARRGFRRIASFTLALESLLVALPIGVSWGGIPDRSMLGIVVALAAAMGVQTATLTRIGPLTVHTTFVTGMINKFAELVSHALFLSYDIFVHHRPLRSQGRKSASEAAYIFSIWLIYFFGGVIGAILAHGTGLRSLLLPFAILVLAVIVDQLQPLSLEEEREELSQAA